MAGSVEGRPAITEGRGGETSYDVSPLAPELETKIKNRSLKRGKEISKKEDSMFSFLKRKIQVDKLSIEETMDLWRKGKLNPFPCYLFSAAEWPAPWWVLAPTVKAIIGTCPQCGGSQQLGQRDAFPATYKCRCGFQGSHPLDGLSSCSTYDVEHR